MTTKDLIHLIIDNGHPYNLVNFTEEYPDQAYCICLSQGKWEVYFSKNGEKLDYEKFDSEALACINLWNRIKQS